MKYRLLFGLSFAIVLAAATMRVPAKAQTPAPAPPAKVTAPPSAKAWKQPRTADGKPDFSGYWSNSTVTPLERPTALAGKETVTDAEAKVLEKAGNRDDKHSNGAPGSVGDYNGLWYEHGKTVLANRRTSIITDPPDGRIPPLTPAAAAKMEEERKNYFSGVLKADGPEDLDTITRCITWITSGPPMLPTFYNNNYQFVQSKDSLVIVSEMIHDARIVHMDNGSHPDGALRQWMGDSRGHWDGDTLVVETTNFNGKRNFLGAGRSGAGRLDDQMKVVERFTRVAPDILLYQFTVDNPSTYTRPWSGEIPLRVTQGPLYEYACHEGNYALVDILSGARAKEKAGEVNSSRTRPAGRGGGQ
jgi:hypothetical protein